ncbi:major facilitator superfamily domain-containing protein [Fusarium oxysporum f. sp. albedinis]|nr:major facilitator superfamily domain-containing protein [Fusarium oxysporum f. sp. albedinis]
MATNTVAESITTSSMDPSRQGDAIEMSSSSQSPLNTTKDIVRNEEEPPEHATSAIPDGGYGWTIVGSCFTLLFWINGYTTAWGVLQAAIVQSPRLHTNIRTITFVGSLYMACMVAFGLISVRLSREYGIRITSLVATIFFGSGLIITSFTLEHLAGLFCIAGLLVGLSTSLLYTATNTMPTQWFSRKLGTANGIVKAGGGVGATVLPLATQAMIDKVGLQWTFRILGASILVTGIPCAFLLTELTRGATTSRFDWSQLRSMPFLTLTMSGAVGVFALFVPPFFLPVFARSIGLSASTGAGLVAGFGASTAVGRLFGGWICDRIGAFNSLALAALINSVSMLAIWPVSSSLPPLFAFAIINGCANGSFFVALSTAVAALAPGSAAASISLMTSFWTPGYLMGAPLAGILIDAAGASEASSIEPYRAAIFYAAGVGSAATFLIVVSRLMLMTSLLGESRGSSVERWKRLVVTNEHLNRALHYFGILILITDVTFDKEEETSIPQNDHFRNPSIPDINGTPNTHQPPSNTQPGSSSTTLPAKLKASDGPLYSLYTSQKRKERKSTTT